MITPPEITPPEQLSFALPARPALGREDFFVSPANQGAVTMIEGWRNWPDAKLALIGPEGAGKTHLAHVWAALSGAAIVPAAELPQADIPALATGPVAVEDAEGVAGDRPAEEALFHLHNMVLAGRHTLLLTARRAPARWPLTLPDLASRMQATALARLSEPDDALLSAVLMKLFADRQIAPSPETVPYLARRIDRSFRMAHRVVTALDAAALSQGRAVNRRLAAEVLEALT